jgi:hypothetical protein
VLQREADLGLSKRVGDGEEVWNNICGFLVPDLPLGERRGILLLVLVDSGHYLVVSPFIAVGSALIFD